MMQEKEFVYYAPLDNMYAIQAHIAQKMHMPAIIKT